MQGSQIAFLNPKSDFVFLFLTDQSKIRLSKVNNSSVPLTRHDPIDLRINLGHVAALVRSHVNGLLPFERTIEQTTETMRQALKQYKLQQ